MIITNRARRVGRAAVAARYRSDKEKLAITAGKMDDNPNVSDATRAAQMMMDEMLPSLTIAEIALDANNIAVMRVSASAIKKATSRE